MNIRENVPGESGAVDLLHQIVGTSPVTLGGHLSTVTTGALSE